MPRRNLAAALLAVQSCAEASRMPQRVAGLLGLLRRTGDAALGKALRDGLRRMLETRFGDELPRRWTGEPMTLEHRMDKWEQEWSRQGREEWIRRGIRRGREEGRAELAIDARYVGQNFELAVPLGATGHIGTGAAEQAPGGVAGRTGAGAVDCPVYDRQSLRAGHALDGPAIVEQLDSTTPTFPGDRAVVDSAGNLVIRLHDGAGAGRPSARIDAPPSTHRVSGRASR